MNVAKATDGMLDKIGELIAERDRLREVIAAANARYERAEHETPSFTVATDMYIELAAAGDVEGDLEASRAERRNDD